VTDKIRQLLSAADVSLYEATTAEDAESMRTSRNECAGALTRSAVHISPEEQSAWWQTLNRAFFTPYVVTYKGEHVGYAIKRLENGRWWLTAGLRAPYRGRGLGFIVFRKLIALTGTPCYLEVNTDNVSALKLYRRLGFKVIDFTEFGATAFFTMELCKPPPLVSIIFGTYNRRQMLTRFLNGLEEHIREVPYEIVVCDGGSTDGSREMLAERDNVLLIGERRLEGAVKAFNQCYALSRGEYVALLNDDLVVCDRGIDEAALHMESHRMVGQVAMGFKQGNHNAMIAGSLPGHIFANLGVTRRDAADLVRFITGGIWPAVYYTYGADTELSCWIERLGLEIFPIRRSCFHDLLAPDALRQANAKAKVSHRDNRTFWERWWDVKCLRPKGPAPRVTPNELTRLEQVEAQA